MRVIERYIIQSIIRSFFLCILSFCFLYILIDIASNLNELIDRKVPFGILGTYYLSFLPIILVQTSPIACLIASLLTFGRLNNNNEVIVMRAGGLNFWRITKPAVIFALIVSAGIFLVNERFVPRATVSSDEIRNENIILQVDSDRKKKAPIKNLTFYGLRNRLYFIDSFDPNTYALEGITILEQDKALNISEKIVAMNGKWTGLAWKFFKCQVTEFDPTNLENPEEINFYEEKLMDIKEGPLDFMRQRLNVDSMNSAQLYEYIRRFSDSGAVKTINSLKVDLFQKIAFPFGNIAILMVGLPLALLTGRRKALTFTTLGIAVAIGFFYYVINAVGLAFGKEGLFPPFLSAWVAPIIFGAVSAYLIKKFF